MKSKIMIKVKGNLDETWKEWFEGIVITNEGECLRSRAGSGKKMLIHHPCVADCRISRFHSEVVCSK